MSEQILVTPMADLGLTIFFILIGLGFFIVMMSLITPRKSQEYRKLITDLYVSAKAKFLAKEDGLDLESEFQEFTKWRKKDRVSKSEVDLDKAIEAELKERVTEPTNKKESKK